ncbi:MAG: 50S ribosomal protein L29 [Legionellales bacterium]|nr:50S ribosomal protein L29 [Legionellales bacterium]
MKLEEIRKKSETELLKEVLLAKKELLSLRVQASSGELANTNMGKLVRKRIARIKTVLTEKGL